jgi:molybdate transport system regulatory protein
MLILHGEFMAIVVSEQVRQENSDGLTCQDTIAFKLRCKIWIENSDGKPILGEGRLRILQAVRRTGSISKAARALNQPFRNVWGKIRAAEQQCGFKLLETNRSGSRLTAEGERLMQKYADLARSCARSANDKFRKVFAEDD